MKWIFVFFLFFCNTSFSVLADENNAKMAVEKCASAYVKSVGRIDNHIDRVYVQESKRMSTAGFVHGALGYFGERDENYGLYFICDFKDGKVLRIVDNASQRLLFGKKRENGYGDFYKGKVYIYSFLRKGDSFEFYGSGLYAVDGKPTRELIYKKK